MAYYSDKRIQAVKDGVESENPDAIYEAVNDVYQKFYAPEPAAEVEEKEVDRFAIFPVFHNVIGDQLKSYTQAMKLNSGSTVDVLAWWKQNSKAYPNLSNSAPQRQISDKYREYLGLYKHLIEIFVFVQII